ncbi:hypothetical protein POM88_046573 [Heracleum sosnowskyi]|uniref:hAT-like transposase RNase-H fold domain-containing protein n=1 Tax=Heracleum sosnowskyi TaxID=360622 RepID=A0AAD8H991_9APIA|nr:hypothetical protein POM88_046573 [Heracleum sosnowskyi]
MVGSMKEKYDKYWGDVEDINPLFFLAIVLDQRYKMGYLKYCFECVYDAESVARIVMKVHQSNTPLNVGNEKSKRRLLESYLHQQKMEITEKKNDLDREYRPGH